MHFLKTLTSLVLGLSTLVSAATYTNPIKAKDGSDPHIVYSGGYYYLMTTTWTNLQITRATTINGLKTGTTKTVYSQSSGSRSGNIWAAAPPPWDSFSFLATLSSTWGIDGTILRFSSWGNYFVYSCFLNGSPQSLCISKLNSPGSIGSPKLISQPTLSWETVRNPVNEGPAAMYHGGKTYLTYSASDCWTTSYSLGLLTWNGSGDPSLASSWSKSGPLLTSANGNYGTGHNGFFQSPDGTEIWNVYHATANSAGACDGNRYTMVNKVNWNSNGTPNFGVPAKLGTSFTGPSGE
ncbi:hypothetical protein N0V90_001862 [Kalmusia sp. IMI 367209]|nr:hypothetical protein N0V90_001862 [Kalmusia sp. IMI 367209]